MMNGKRLFSTFASSILLAASALAPTPALAQTGGGGSGGGGSYCTCQGSHLGGCYSDETNPCYDYCEYYRYYIYGPPPPECGGGYYQPVEEPKERPSEEQAEPAGR